MVTFREPGVAISCLQGLNWLQDTGKYTSVRDGWRLAKSSIALVTV